MKTSAHIIMNSLIGILSKLSGILADNKIGIFTVSTYNTDYILVKEKTLTRLWISWQLKVIQ